MSPFAFGGHAGPRLSARCLAQEPLVAMKLGIQGTQGHMGHTPGTRWRTRHPSTHARPTRHTHSTPGAIWVVLVPIWAYQCRFWSFLAHMGRSCAFLDLLAPILTFQGLTGQCFCLSASLVLSLSYLGRFWAYLCPLAPIWPSWAYPGLFFLIWTPWRRCCLSGPIWAAFVLI